MHQNSWYGGVRTSRGNFTLQPFFSATRITFFHSHHQSYVRVGISVVYLSKCKTPYPAGYATSSVLGSQSSAALLLTVNPRTVSNLICNNRNIILLQGTRRDGCVMLKNLSLNPSPVSNPSMLCFSFSSMQNLCKSYLRLVIYITFVPKQRNMDRR